MKMVYITRHEDVAPAECASSSAISRCMAASLVGEFHDGHERYHVLVDAWAGQGPDRRKLLRNIGSACASIEEMFEPLLSEDEAA